MRPPAGTPLRVGLLGRIGTGNLGNEGALDAVLELLRTETDRPVVPVVLSDDPDRTRREHPGVEVRLLNGRPPRWTERLPHVVRTAVVKTLDLARAVRDAGRWDVLMVAGCGEFERLGSGPAGLPLDMLRLALATRLRGGRFVLFGIGAEQHTGRLMRALLRATVALACYVSVRDEFSVRSLRAIGARTADIQVHPDVVFSDERLSRPRGARPAAVAIAVGVMDYYGLPDDRSRGAQLHEEYVAKLSELVARLLTQGMRVRLIYGDTVDIATADDVAARARAVVPSGDLEIPQLAALPDIAAVTAAADCVVATRFHNVVVAVITGTPVVSVGYGPKNDVLLESLGLGWCVQQIESLDVDLLEKQVAGVLQTRDEVGEQLVLEAGGHGSAVRAAFAAAWRVFGSGR